MLCGYNIGMVISASDREHISTIIEKLKARRNDMDLRIMSFDDLYALLTKPEAVVIEKLLKLKPSNYGFKGGFLGVSDVPSDLVRITGQKYVDIDEEKIIGTQFLPKSIFDAYTELNRAMKADIGEQVLVNSGYRSPAYQIVVFIEILKKNEYNVAETASRVALPGYSQHGYPRAQAMDVMPTRIPEGYAEDLESFTRTPQYKWFKANATRFGFVESYPKGNDLGVIYEPWHWQYMPSIAD